MVTIWMALALGVFSSTSGAFRVQPSRNAIGGAWVEDTVGKPDVGAATNGVRDKAEEMTSRGAGRVERTTEPMPKGI